MARNNTRGTEEREVLYPWHPWFGRVIRVHEVIRRGSGDILRCSLDGAGERIELPPRMFDRTVCSCVSMTAAPRLNAAALTALEAAPRFGLPPRGRVPANAMARNTRWR